MSIEKYKLIDWAYVFHVERSTVLMEITFTEVESNDVQEVEAYSDRADWGASRTLPAETSGRIKAPTSASKAEEQGKVIP